LAGAYAGLGMFREAATNLEANKGLTDFEDERLLILGEAYFRMGKNLEAAETLETFLKTFPQHEKLPQALVDLGRVERILGETDRAIRHLNLALTRDPTLDADGRIQGMLGELYLKKEQFDLAVTSMQSSLASLQAQPEAKADVFLTYSRLGQAYTNLGRDREALGALNSALDFMPENPFPETLYLISDAFRRLGRQDKYLELLDLLAKSPDAFWRRVAEQKLRGIATEDKTSRLISPAAKAGVSNAQP
jgi:tetratricopeptide (TPR) repeat protein